MQTSTSWPRTGLKLTPTLSVMSSPQRQPSENQTLESARKQIIAWLTGRGSIRCAASNGLEFNYVKNELRLKDGNKQGALMFYSSHTPKIPLALNNSSSQLEPRSLEPFFFFPAPFSLQIRRGAIYICAKTGVVLIILLQETNIATQWLQSSDKCACSLERLPQTIIQYSDSFE